MKRLAAFALVALSACATAPPRVLPKGKASLTGGLVSVAAGTYASVGGDVDLTYVADPTARLCFASTHVIGDDPLGLTTIDCCALRYVPEVATALPELATTCPATAITPAPAAPAAPAVPATPAP